MAVVEEPDIAQAGLEREDEGFVKGRPSEQAGYKGDRARLNGKGGRERGEPETVDLAEESSLNG